MRIRFRRDGVVLWIMTGTIVLALSTCEKPQRILQFDTLEAGAADISFSSATVKGEITDLGSKPIGQHGLLLSESSVPSIGQQNTIEKPLGTINKKGVFQTQFTGLKANTTYYFRAFVVVDGTPEAASIKQFQTPDSQKPAITAGTVSGITMTSASLNGEVTSDGGEPSTVRGLCWGLSANPTIATCLDTTKNGTGAGTFIGVMTSLTPGTQYYVKTYATNSKGTVYSTEIPFKTHSLPVVTTTAISNITTAGATSGGEVVDDGGVDVTLRGVCWSTTTGPTTALPTKTTDGTGEGVFTSAITGLTSGATYYVRAYATNQFGTSYGAELSFTASATILPPSATTSSATPVGTTTVTLNGLVNANGLSTTVTFEYGNTTGYGQTATASQSPVTGTSATSVSASLTGLSPSTTYHFRVKAVSTGGTAYGDDVTFNTTSALPTVNDYDGNTYNIVTIGTQEWLQSNLRTEHYNNGEPVPEVQGNSTWESAVTGAMCYYNNDEASFKSAYGGMYNWYAATDIRNICPVGWHSPSDDEWAALASSLGGDNFAGGKLKEAGVANWAAPNAGATNETGFTAYPTGYRAYSGGYGYMGQYGYWWTTTAGAGTDAWYNFMAYDHEAVSKLSGSYNYGFAVRCIKGAQPMVATSAATAMTSSSVTLNGKVNPNGASTTITFEYGITTSYGSTATAVQSPAAGSIPVNVSANITGLSGSTTYHYRVKAVNAGGTIYGADAVFTTQTALPTASDYDGNSYNIVTIGTQEWMQRNLLVTHYSNGDAISNVTDNATWGGLSTAAYSWYNNDAGTYKETYGALYNWYAANDIRNVCPTGWHVPTDAEFTALSTYLGGESVAGGKLKEEGYTHWISPNTGATNETGFTALPGGERETDGGYSAIEYSAFLWSATPWDANSSWARFIANSQEYVLRSYYNNKYGYSVRCIKGAIPLVQTAPATAIASASAILIGRVNPNGLSTTITLEYGTSTSYGSSVTPAQSPASGTAPVEVSASLASLTPGITYHYRIKAVNSAGTSYGTNMVFVTPDLVSDADGNSYNTVITGTQTWIKENLKTTKYATGDAISNITDATEWTGLTTGAYCWYDNSETTYKAYYGALYNWYAVRDVRNICPAGWHVPLESEWTQLETFLGGSSVAGGKLKETGTVHWSSPNVGATNESGFYARGGGDRWLNGWFTNYRTNGFWYSLDETDATNARSFYILGSQAYSGKSTYPKYYGFSVRCLKGALPLAETSAATGVASTSVTLNGKINPNGPSTTVTFEYGTTTAYGSSATATQSPLSGTSPVAVSAAITGLTPNTTYHYRVKAVNSGGTIHGSDMTFYTPARVADADGNIYNAVVIGTQTWMQENLKTRKYNDVTSVPLVTDGTEWSNLTTPGFCYYENDAVTHEDTYGALYNWYAVNTGKLCPAGWHVPTDAEWTAMENYLITNGYNYDGTTTENKIAKALAATTNWTASTETGAVGNIDYPTKRNVTGFTALPGGYRSSGGVFYYIGTKGRWWSATESHTNNAWAREMINNVSNVGRDNLYERNGFSVRCLKD